MSTETKAIVAERLSITLARLDRLTERLEALEAAREVVPA